MYREVLRQKLIDLAFSGKKVSLKEGEIEVSPVSELLRSIFYKKERLVSEKRLKIREIKRDSLIIQCDDNLHYEKFRDGSQICIEKEIPYQLPDGWAWTRLSSICTIITDGTHFTPKYSKSGYPFLSSSNIVSGIINWNNIKYITNELHQELSSRISPIQGDILLSKNGTIGSAAIVDCNTVFDIYVSLALIRIADTRILPEYIKYALETTAVQCYFQKNIKGIGVPNLHLEKIKNTLIPIAPLKQQKQICRFLKDSQEVVSTFEANYQQLEQLIEKTKYRLLDAAVTGTDFLKFDSKNRKNYPDMYFFDFKFPFTVPEHWKFQKLGEVCHISRGRSPRPIKDYFTNSSEGVNWIKISDANPEEKYIYTARQKIKPEGVPKSHYVKAGDLLLSNSMSFGQPYILKIDGCVHDGWLILHPNHIDLEQEYLYYLLRSKKMFSVFNRLASGSTVKNLNVDLIRSVVIPIPPLKEQLYIISNVQKYMDKIRQIEKNMKENSL